MCWRTGCPEIDLTIVPVENRVRKVRVTTVTVSPQIASTMTATSQRRSARFPRQFSISNMDCEPTESIIAVPLYPLRVSGNPSPNQRRSKVRMLTALAIDRLDVDHWCAVDHFDWTDS